VRLVGGCCGTTPEHIRQIKLAITGQGRGTLPHRPGAQAAPTVDAPSLPPVPRAEKSRMAHALARGKFILGVAIEPPRGHDPSPALELAQRLRIRGVDVVTITDAPRGARMSALSLAVLIQQAGLEPVLQYACRDRYLLGMQSDLLGAHAVGVRNLLLFTGDPRAAGDYSDSVVFEVDSIGLTNAVTRLNRGCDVGGQAIGRPTAFHTGVIANPTAPDLDEELRRFQYKAEAGAEYAVTEPIFDVAALDTFLPRIEHVRIPVIATVRPFDSLRHAEYLANEVPNLRVPEALIERMRRVDGADAEAREGVAVAQEIARAVCTRVQGIQIEGPDAAVLAVLDGL
jgi:methionine synthase / methylenetetrahydrofolate reductase(NADPH)